MKKLYSILLIAMVLAPVAASAWFDSASSSVGRTSGYTKNVTVANLPACNTTTTQGMLATVNDATGATDCQTGGSTTVNTCFCAGVNWTNVASTGIDYSKLEVLSSR